jgi:tRNA dimethylallyltransferase
VTYLEPPTERLRTVIAERAEAMVGTGLLDEVAVLRRRPRSRTAIAAIGYAEAEAVLDGHAAAEGLAHAIADRTWRYARRQRSWFRADPRCAVVGPEEALRAWG